MGYRYMADAWKKPNDSYVRELMQQRAISWRDEPAIIRIDKPTRLDRARRLGYKAKKGFVIVRVRVKRSGFRKLRPRTGRRQKRMGVEKIKLKKSIRLIAEERASRRFPNLEVLNSYWVWEDGIHKWFEVIMGDRLLLPNLKLGNGRGRAFRGLTSAGRKVRGLLS